MLALPEQAGVAREGALSVELAEVAADRAQPLALRVGMRRADPAVAQCEDRAVHAREERRRVRRRQQRVRVLAGAALPVLPEFLQPRQAPRGVGGGVVDEEAHAEEADDARLEGRHQRLVKGVELCRRQLDATGRRVACPPLVHIDSRVHRLELDAAVERFCELVGDSGGKVGALLLLPCALAPRCRGLELDTVLDRRQQLLGSVAAAATLLD